MSERGTCRSCGAPILWVKTNLGNKTCLNAEPVEGGNVVIETVDKEDVARTLKRDLLNQENPAGPRYVSHFSTCPDAKKHRKRK